MKVSYYINRGDEKSVAEEEKNNFIKTVLTEFGIPLEDIWPEDGVFSIKQKIDLKNILSKFNINIISHDDTLIYVDKDLVATWKKPIYILRKDLSEINPNKKIFIEMIIEYNSIFEENK